MKKNLNHKLTIVKTWVWRIFALLLLLAIMWGANEADYFVVSVGLISFVIIVMPIILERAFKIYFPTIFELALLFFLFLSLYLGEIQAWYVKIWWWDLMLHTISGLMIGILGFMIVYLLHTNKRTSLNLSPLFLALFSFGFAQSFGVLWEIFEFVMDSYFGQNMQKSGIVDTMGDLIVNTLGALLVSVYGYFYLKNNNKKPLKIIKKILTRYS